MALKIVIETVPHNQQRYETVGDWYIAPDASWHIKVSAMDDWHHEVLVAIHELVEMALCMDEDISSALVDAYDTNYNGDCIEPGDDSGSPYQRQHSIATGVERIIAAELNVKWQDYDDEVNAL